MINFLFLFAFSSRKVFECTICKQIFHYEAYYIVSTFLSSFILNITKQLNGTKSMLNIDASGYFFSDMSICMREMKKSRFSGVPSVWWCAETKMTLTTTVICTKKFHHYNVYIVEGILCKEDISLSICYHT